MKVDELNNHLRLYGNNVVIGLIRKLLKEHKKECSFDMIGVEACYYDLRERIKSFLIVAKENITEIEKEILNNGKNNR